jgi:hypothetical protein
MTRGVFSSSGKREDAEPRGEGLQEILYQAYDLRGFFRFANLLAIADLRICELANCWRQKKRKKIANSQFTIRNCGNLGQPNKKHSLKKPKLEDN